MLPANSASAHNKDFFDAFIVDSGEHASVSDLLHANIRVGTFLSSDANMQQQPMQNNVGMDVLEGLMAMQDNRGGQPNAMSTTGQPTPQMLMEHQMRLNQLQQLYQLQTQIFQQQVRFHLFLPPARPPAARDQRRSRAKARPYT